MHLLVIKCNEGYIKYTLPDEVKVVGLNKASVFNETDIDHVKNAVVVLKNRGFTGIRAARLHVTETDFFLKEEELIGKLSG